ncbi:sulfatase-like hydrolase/transferase [Flammeovirga sp. SubArs3]|uniref:sulfatase family protein n=1 Tax=Flammeovirga sp. SubArs3 TaxID=2995316 RepID=UPI00248CDA90|nr:sulfatase-like hydrolase/transferase [Flammeovirga sp. SubArs3]
MKRNLFITLFIYLAGITTVNATSGTGDDPNKGKKGKPNIVIFYTDDLGYGDLSVNGGLTPTPNIDKIFTTGLTFNNYNTHCVCSPSRAGMLTGKHYVKTNSGPKTGGELSTDEKTFPETLQENGFVTGAFGKWHNGAPTSYGENEKKNSKRYQLGAGVNAHGFDRFVGYYGGGGNYFTRYSNVYGQVSWYHDKTNKPNEKGYTTDLITKYALEFIEKNKEERFLAYIPHEAMHNPLQAKYKDIQRVPEAVKQGTEILSEEEYKKYFKGNKAWMKMSEEQKQIVRSAMLLSLDDAVGEVLEYLKKENLLDNTIVMFTSDNGATPEGNNLPFKGHKHTIYEGGIHVPMAMMWKNGGLNKGNKYEGDFNFLDIYPTLTSMVGAKRDETIAIDGRDLSKSILSNTENAATVQQWVWTGEGAVKEGNWKLIYNPQEIQLYDLSKDLKEENNLASQYPEKVEAMKKLHIDFLRANTINPSYLPTDHLPSATAEAKPDGEVLEFFIEQTAAVKSGKDIMRFAFAEGYDKMKYTIEPGDVVEYDIMVAEDGMNEGFFYSPTSTWKVLFAKSGYDQYGRYQKKGPGVKAGKGKWEHRVIGIGEATPQKLSYNMMSFQSRKPGTYHFYIDNLIARKADGTVITLWSSGKDTIKRYKEKPFMKNRKENIFKTVQVQSVELGSIQ